MKKGFSVLELVGKMGRNYLNMMVWLNEQLDDEIR